MQLDRRGGGELPLLEWLTMRTVCSGRLLNPLLQRYQNYLWTRPWTSLSNFHPSWPWCGREVGLQRWPLACIRLWFHLAQSLADTLEGLMLLIDPMSDFLVWHRSPRYSRTSEIRWRPCREHRRMYDALDTDVVNWVMPYLFSWSSHTGLCPDPLGLHKILLKQ